MGVESILQDWMECRGWYEPKRVGVGMMSGRTATMTSEKESKHGLVIPHSNNGRCTNLGCVDELCGVGQPNVGWGSGRWQWQSWVSDGQNFGCDWCALESSIHACKHALIVIIVVCWCPNLSPALLLVPSHSPAAFLHLLPLLHALPYVLPWHSSRVWQALPLAIIAIIDALAVDIESPGMLYVVMLYESHAGWWLSSMSMWGILGRSEWGPGVWQIEGIAWLTSSLSMDLTVLSNLWAYVWCSLVGGLASGGGGVEWTLSGLLGLPEA